MKVIGKGETRDSLGAKETLILEASIEEIANLIGYHSSYSEGFNRKVGIGTDINVHGMFKTLYNMAAQQKQLEQAAGILRTAADMVTLAAPVIVEISKDQETAK